MTQEMTRYFLLILLITFPLLEVGCQEIPQRDKHAEQASALSFIKKDGTLKSKEREKSCLLADDAIDYEVFVSPDTKLIAVETLLMSNLQIIRVYKKNANGCFQPLKHVLSTKLWHKLSTEKGFSLDDIRYPKMRFLKWIDHDTMLINLSGEMNTQSIDKNMTFVPIFQNNTMRTNATL